MNRGRFKELAVLTATGGILLLLSCAHAMHDESSHPPASKRSSDAEPRVAEPSDAGPTPRAFLLRAIAAAGGVDAAHWVHMIVSDITYDTPDAGTHHRRVVFGGPDRERWDDDGQLFVIDGEQVWWRDGAEGKFRVLDPAHAAPYLAEHAVTWPTLLLAPLVDRPYDLAFMPTERGHVGIRVSGLGIRDCTFRFDDAGRLERRTCLQPDGRTFEQRFDAFERCGGVLMPSRLHTYVNGEPLSILDVKHTCSWWLDDNSFVHPVL